MKGKKKEQTIIAILLIALIITIVCLLYQKQSSTIVLDEDAKIYEGKVIRPDEWDENQIAIPGYETIQMEQDTDVLPIVLVNPKGNPCYFKFSLYLDDGNEVHYQSDYIEPGHMVQNVKLKEKVASGTHKLVIDIETTSLHDSETKMNGSQVITEIITYEK